MAKVGVEIHGLLEAQHKIDQVAEDLHGKPMVESMHNATLIVLRSARMLAPVNDGQLRASIAERVDVRGVDVEGVVGSNLF